MRTILIIFVLSGACWAVGGTCPAGSNYVDPTSTTLTTLSSLGVTSCYYADPVSGLDTNTGLDESHPWKFLPFMPSCASNCLTVQNQSAATWQGEGLIVKGGTTYNFGNSGGAAYTGGMWEWNTGTTPVGASGSPIYIGIDLAWFTGGSWTRPILTGDNPLCNSGNAGSGGCNTGSTTCTPNTSSCPGQFYVNSCTYQIGNPNNFIDFTSGRYFIFDDFEMTGMCQSIVGQPGKDNYVRYGSASGPLYFDRLYIHGWTHLQFAGANGGSSCTAGVVCFDILGFQGSTTSGTQGDTFRYVVMDGSDSDPIGAGFAQSGLYDTAYSAYRYTSQTLTAKFHLFHDNLVENFYENGHSNMLEATSESAGTNASYNNVFRHIEAGCASGCGVGIWPLPPVGTTDYWFNNLYYDQGAIEVFNAGQNGSNQGALDIFNNTFEFTSSGSNISCSSTSNSGAVNSTNNHFITDNGGGAYATNCSSAPLTQTTDNTMSHSTATSDGYTSSQTFAYSPTSGGSPTVGTGTNKNSTYCSALTSAGLTDAATRCLQGTQYACSYSVTAHVMTCPALTATARPTSAAWDQGAYEYPLAGAPPPTGTDALSGVTLRGGVLR